MQQANTTLTADVDVNGDVAEWVVALTLPERSFVDGALGAAQLEAGTRMLDLGCGTGHLLERAAQREPSAIFIGVDIDADCVELARRRARSAPTRIEIHVCDGRELPFSDDYFDVISLTLLLGTLPRQMREQMLAEARRVLAPGGRIVMADFRSRGCVIARVFRDATELLPGSAYWSGARAAHISAEIANGGFETPQLIRSYCTVAGAIDLLVAHKPLIT